MEEGIKRRKSEAGMADEHVRKGVGWHHHIALSLHAIWLMIREARRGKQHTPALTIPRFRDRIASLWEDRLGSNRTANARRRPSRWVQRNERARFYRDRKRHLLPLLKIEQSC